MNYFFDSYAIIEILKQNPNYDKFQEFDIITSDLNIGEVYYYLLKTLGKDQADIWYQNLNVKIYPIDTNCVVNSIIFRYQNKKKKLSMVDCVGYKLSLKHNIKFLTGDHEFKDLPNVEYIK